MVFRHRLIGYTCVVCGERFDRWQRCKQHEAATGHLVSQSQCRRRALEDLYRVRCAALGQEADDAAEECAALEKLDRETSNNIVREWLEEHSPIGGPNPPPPETLYTGTVVSFCRFESCYESPSRLRGGGTIIIDATGEAVFVETFVAPQGEESILYEGDRVAFRIVATRRPSGAEAYKAVDVQLICREGVSSGIVVPDTPDEVAAADVPDVLANRLADVSVGAPPPPPLPTLLLLDAEFCLELARELLRS